MVCLRCGYCCIMHPVVILDDSAEDGVSFKAEGIPCKHLSYSEGLAQCAVHSRKDYVDTPCDRHDQIGLPIEECRIGKAFVTGKITVPGTMRDAVHTAHYGEAGMDPVKLTTMINRTLFQMQRSTSALKRELRYYAIDFHDSDLHDVRRVLEEYVRHVMSYIEEPLSWELIADQFGYMVKIWKGEKA